MVWHKLLFCNCLGIPIFRQKIGIPKQLQNNNLCQTINFYHMPSLPPTTVDKCEQILASKIEAVQAVSGGDINDAYVVTTATSRYFVKTNNADYAGDLFEKEAEGLEAIRRTNAIVVPEVIGYGNAETGAFLLLEFIKEDLRTDVFWTNFGKQLALLHRNIDTFFGFKTANYIGRLHQPNGQHLRWVDFYISERLIPQLEMAISKDIFSKKDLSHFEKLFQVLPELCPVETPSLIHGDLWSGNFLAGTDNTPVLIDPAVSYNHREMDLAMTKLFGGFSGKFYESYQYHHPTQPGFLKRMPIYQLYYLLAHVNLFGGSYVESVRAIIRQF